VPSTGRNCAAPSKTGEKVGPLTRGIVAVWGIELAMTASLAWGVPATAASTTPAGAVGGMRRKSAGKSVLATKLHGPLKSAARYQRPATRM